MRRDGGTQARANRGFARGLVMGVTATLVLVSLTLYLLSMTNVVAVSLVRVPEIHLLLSWCHRNLGLSLLPFGMTLLLFLRDLSRLQRALREGRTADEVAQIEHMVDVWTGLFFGIGVLWTAIGMRGALIVALGETESVARTGAFSILQRLVDGGILVALSTTVFGGAGGYLMRVLKAVAAGRALRRFYLDTARASGDAVLACLERIEGELRRQQTPAAIDGRKHEPAPLATQP